MADPRTVIHETGRWWLWIRVPCLAWGLLCLALAVDLLCMLLFGAHFLWFLTIVPQPVGVTILAIAFLFLLGFAFVNAWVFRQRVVFVPDTSLILEINWVGGTLRRSTPLGEIAAVELAPKRGLSTSWMRWLVQLRRTDYGLITLLETSQKEEAEELAERLSWMLGVSLEPV